MVGLTLGNGLMALAAIASVASAVDPSPAERKKWDDKCKAKLGNMYSMTFDSNGQPTGTCTAPPYQGCYWGPYIDPKTGKEGCCEKGNGEFSVDPVNTLEGACCIKPKTYTWDQDAKKGGCCDPGLSASWDLTFKPTNPLGVCCPAGTVASTDRRTTQDFCCPRGLTYSSHVSGAGDCCEPGKEYSYDLGSKTGQCCDVGKSFKIDPSTGKGSCCAADHEFKCDCKCVPSDVDPKCPADHLKIITSGGKKWKIYCDLITHGANDISITPGVASWGECIKNCAKLDNCVRAIFDNTQKICYLRSHGNKGDAVTPGVWSSAHLIEDDKGDKGDPSSGDDKKEPSGGDDKKDPSGGDDKKDPSGGDDKKDPSGGDIGPPKKCPEVNGRIVEVGGVTYEISCKNGITDRFADYKSVTTKDVQGCMEACSADPKCQGANLYDDGADEGCVMVKDWEYPATGGVDPTINMMSLIPVKKR